MKAITYTAVTALALTAFSAETRAASNLSDILTLGNHWYGENLSVDDLKGRVVLFEFWGYN